MTSHLDRNAAVARDAADPLGAKRSEFHLPDGVIYLDGNSLGPVPKAALTALDRAARSEWGDGLIRSWNEAGWFDLPITLGDRVGRLIGAGPGETAVTDSTSINVYKTLHAGLSLRPGRAVIVAEASGFPTDLYIAQGLMGVRPDIRMLLEGVDAARIEDLIDDKTAVVLVNQVDYRTGILRDMAALTARIHAAGAIAVWDLCHSAGALEVDLTGSGADMAVGCSYKYLNGGPGAPAFVWVAPRHHGRYTQPLSGWWGHAAPFTFERTYKPGDGIRPMLCGTQPILSLQALAGALEVWDGVDLAQVRAKSLALTDLFIDLVEARCAGFGVTIAAPRDHANRGSQVSVRHPGGYQIVQALIARGVIGDFRTPDFMRFGFTPLYLSHADVWDAVDILHDILSKETWRDARYAVRGAVT